jgi:hypothetical protein
MIKIAIVVALGLTLGGCLQTTCGSFAEINPSPRDTQGTKDQVLLHNLHGKTLGCPNFR